MVSHLETILTIRITRNISNLRKPIGFPGIKVAYALFHKVINVPKSTNVDK